MGQGGNEAGAPQAAVSLRPLVLADLDRVMELEAELFGAGAWPRGTYIEELTEAPDRVYVAAVDEDDLVGYAGVVIADEAQIMTVGVAQSHQGRGIGARLVDALLDAAREAGARSCLLEVRAADEGAQRLYARAGFTPLGLRRRYYPGGEDAVVMRARLRPPRHTGPGPIGAEVTGT